MTSASRSGLLISSFIWLAVTVFGVYLLFNIRNYINFGIDLVGGTYLTLDVKVEEAVKNELLSITENLTENLKKKNLALPNVTKINESEGTAILEFDSGLNTQAALDLFNTELEQTFRTQGAESGIKADKTGNLLKFTLTNSQIRHIKEEAVESNISIIRTRLDVFGAGEITIFPQGERSIVIELPNVGDPEKAKAKIGKTALLEMKPIYDQAKTVEDLMEKLSSRVPEGSMIIQGKPGTRESGAYLVSNFSKLTGRLLKDVSYEFKQLDLFSGNKSPHTVNFQFNAEGSQRFYNLTKAHPNEQIGIIIDNVVVSAPYVNEPIEGGKAFISGDFTEESAKELVSLLKSGSFAAPVEFVEERHIGPSLGQESISRGLMSCGIGLGLLFIFSLFVYKVAGLFAFIVLLYNLLFILFGLAIIPDATLTLPGIAGMVLTVGMAIDSSILIYERIKEELALGSSLRNAISSGFKGATGVILDANITTFIVGAVLYYFGSPAIQGFALAIMIGIVSTLITGLILLKWLFNFSLDMGIRKISF